MIKAPPSLGQSSIAALFLFIVAALPSAAEVPVSAPASSQARFRRLGVADGLSESRLRDVMQDRRGFLWICTVNGLDRYDGSRFRTFRNDPQDPASLAPGFPLALAEDQDGQIWVGLLGGGLSRFDPGTERFTHYRHSPEDSTSIGNDNVHALLLDREGTLWVGTRGGLDYKPRDASHFQRFDLAGTGLRRDSVVEVTSLAQDPSGALWAGSSRFGVFRIVRGTGEPRVQQWRHAPGSGESLSSDNVLALAIADKEAVWVGTWDSGLDRIDAGDGRVTHQPLRGAGHQATRVYDLLRDHRGGLWIATWGSGLWHLDPRSAEVTPYLPDPADSDSISHAIVASLYEDRNHLLWIGTSGGGLDCLDLEAKPFERHRVHGIGEGGFPVWNVRALVEDRSGDIWLGFAGAGLVRIDREGRVRERFRHDPRDPGSLADNDVWSLLQAASRFGCSLRTAMAPGTRQGPRWASMCFRHGGPLGGFEA